MSSASSRPPRAARRAETERLASLGEIAAEVAHELRNALQIVSSNVYLARQDPAASEPHLAKIERSARVAHGIVDDVMALARGDALQAELVPMRTLLAAARELLPVPGATFVDDLELVTLEARVHLGLMARLLHVLYENAIRAAAASAQATITTRVLATDEPGRLRIEVSDDGPGVPESIASTLFEPLVTARKGGSGLGLALARRIAEAHGGSIVHVPSPAGATFRIELPT